MGGGIKGPSLSFYFIVSLCKEERRGEERRRRGEEEKKRRGEEEEFAQAIGEERSLLKPQAATIGEPKR